MVRHLMSPDTLCKTVFRGRHRPLDSEEASCLPLYRFQRYLEQPRCTCSWGSNRVHLPLSSGSSIFVTSWHSPSPFTKPFRSLRSIQPSPLSYTIFLLCVLPYLSRLLPSCLRLQPFPRVKQIAKYPQVVDFTDYVLRVTHYRTRQDKYKAQREYELHVPLWTRLKKCRWADTLCKMLGAMSLRGAILWF